MNRRHALAILASALSSPLLFGCAQDSVTLRYRLRIDIRIDDAIYTGASVIEVYVGDFGKGSIFRAPEAGRFGTRSWGEAVVVDLPGHGSLFGLLHLPVGFANGFNVNAAPGLLLKAAGQAPNINRFIAVLRDLRGDFPLPEEHYPVLVRFRDEGVPETIEYVDAAVIRDRFGAGAKVEAVRIGVTEDPVTTGIEERLPWLQTPEWTRPRIQSLRSPIERLARFNFVQRGD